MFKPVQTGDRTRYSFGKIKEVLPMPHLIDLQRKSYEWFMSDGLNEIFHDISPIKDFNGNLELSFRALKSVNQNIPLKNVRNGTLLILHR